jgi:hypothetical protein
MKCYKLITDVNDIEKIEGELRDDITEKLVSLVYLDGIIQGFQFCNTKINKVVYNYSDLPNQLKATKRIKSWCDRDRQIYENLRFEIGKYFKEIGFYLPLKNSVSFKYSNPAEHLKVK